MHTGDPPHLSFQPFSYGFSSVGRCLSSRRAEQRAATLLQQLQGPCLCECEVGVGICVITETWHGLSTALMGRGHPWCNAIEAGGAVSVPAWLSNSPGRSVLEAQLVCRSGALMHRVHVGAWPA